jgi:MAF protein
MPQPFATPDLVLASGSPYRASLLARLGLAFHQCPPDLDENRSPGEDSTAYVARLAEAKALAGAHALQASPVISIGSDQVCVVDGDLMGKPGDAPAARAQLRRVSGRAITFLTAVAVHDTTTAETQTAVSTDQVHFRELDDATIERYVAAEAPFDCAGGFRAEGLGITLFEAIDSSDPTSLIGLPLITVSRLLRRCGIALP